MLKDLIKMAGYLDDLGLRREADIVDALIKKVAGEDEDVLKNLKWEEGTDLKEFEELIEYYLHYYSESKNSGNENNEWDSIRADETLSDIANFIGSYAIGYERWDPDDDERPDHDAERDELMERLRNQLNELSESQFKFNQLNKRVEDPDYY